MLLFVRKYKRFINAVKHYTDSLNNSTAQLAGLKKNHPFQDGFFIIRHRAIFPRFETQVL